MITPFLILVNHFFADFLLQTDRMATGKSKSVKWLSLHVLTYTAGMIPVAYSIYLSGGGGKAGFIAGWSWLIANFILHWITDFFTSKWTGYLYRKSLADPKAEWLFQPYVHWFFCVIGFDQIIHFACLLFTYQYFLLS